MINSTGLDWKAQMLKVPLKKDDAGPAWNKGLPVSLENLLVLLMVSIKQKQEPGRGIGLNEGYISLTDALVKVDSCSRHRLLARRRMYSPSSKTVSLRRLHSYILQDNNLLYSKHSPNTNMIQRIGILVLHN